MRLVITIVVFLFSTNAFGNGFSRIVESKTIKPTLVKSLVVDDIPSIVFDEDFARRLLKLRMDYPALKEKTSLQGSMIINLKSQIQIYSEITITMSESNKDLAKTNAKLNNKITDLESWYKSNLLWTFVGFAAGVAVTTAIVLSVN